MLWVNGNNSYILPMNSSFGLTMLVAKQFSDGWGQFLIDCNVNPKNCVKWAENIVQYVVALLLNEEKVTL